MNYARMAIATSPADKLEEFARVYEQEILPALKPVKGFQGAYLFTNAFSGESVSLTFWASEQDAMAYDRSGMYAELVAKLRPLLATEPTLKRYHVSAETPFPTGALR